MEDLQQKLQSYVANPNADEGTILLEQISPIIQPEKTFEAPNLQSFLTSFLILASDLSVLQNVQTKQLAKRNLTSILNKFIVQETPTLIAAIVASIKKAKKENKPRIVYAAIIAFLSQTISFNYLENKIDVEDAVFHFSLADTQNADDLDQVISKLEVPDEEWYKAIIDNLMNSTPTISSRLFLKSVTAAITHAEKHLLPHFELKLLESVGLYDGLVPYSFAVAQCHAKELNTQFLKAAFEVFSSPSSFESATIDAALLIIGIDKSIQIEEDKASLEMDGIDASCTFDPMPFLNRPSFYSLPLPLSLLEPKIRDGQLCLKEKFKTLAELFNSTGNEELLESFSSFVIRPYDDLSSPAIQGVALLQPTSKRVSDLVTIAVCTTPVSWFHSLDILSVIKAFGFSFFFAQGRAKTKKVLEFIVNCTLSESEKLHQTAVDVMSEFINPSTAVEISLLLLKQGDLYDSKHLALVLDAASSFPKESHFYTNSELLHLCFTLTDAFYYHDSDRDLNFSMFKFLHSIPFKVVPGDFIAFIYKAIIGLLANPHFEAFEITKLFNSGSKQFQALVLEVLAHVSIPFIEVDEVFHIVQKYFLLYPVEVTNVIDAFWEEFNSEAQNQLLNYLSLFLVYTKESAFGEICKKFIAKHLKRNHDVFVTKFGEEFVANVPPLERILATTPCEVNYSSFNLSEGVPVATELRHGLREFSSSEISSLFREFCLELDGGAIRAVLDYSRQHQRDIELSPLVYLTDAVEDICKFTDKLGFLRQLSMYTKSKLKFDVDLETDKLEKGDIVLLLQTLPQSSLKLKSCILSSMSNVTSRIKMQLLLRLAGVYFDKTDVEQIAQYFPASLNSSLRIEIITLFNKIFSNCREYPNFVQKYFSNWKQSPFELSVATLKSDKGIRGKRADTLEHLLSCGIPSFFRAAVVFFNKVSNSHFSPKMRKQLTSLLGIAPKYIKYQHIGDALDHFLIGMSSQSVLWDEITASLKLQATFMTLPECSIKYSSDLCMFPLELIVQPLSLLQTYTYIDSIRSRVKNGSTGFQDEICSFLQPCTDLTSYHTTSVFLYFLELLWDFQCKVDLFSLLGDLFMKSTTLFFPFFNALLQFYARHENSPDSEVIREMMLWMAEILQDPDQKNAIRLILDPPRRREAIGIALSCSPCF